ncbi:hypothetical protein SAMN04487910_1653 [Aquimarina amphilecti]|uniref:Uncharacterized protein n=1 Tax=Aquimarina amphilecti TaxID=1038014 RepID=A0A1H7MBU1_AQUAM|nr:hypothetical protein [Aquimarina amphilecti]SEL08087.1 hypothetical protein SAMN04487910_1653 [Aquimarina amphilecti]
MKPLETERMIHFLYRMSMYVSNVSRDNIVSFMHGADFGKCSEPHWTKLLNEFILIEYKIEGRAIGWSYQVELFSKQEGIEWTEGFKKLMLEMINKSDKTPITNKTKNWIHKLENNNTQTL